MPMQFVRYACVCVCEIPCSVWDLNGDVKFIYSIIQRDPYIKHTWALWEKKKKKKKKPFHRFSYGHMWFSFYPETQMKEKNLQQLNI